MHRSFAFAPLFVAAFVIAGFTAAPSVVSAQQRFYVAGWTGHGGALRNGQFQYCAIRRTLVGGTRIVFLLGQGGSFTISLADRRFNFHDSKWISVMYRVDRYPQFWGQGKTGSKNILSFSVPSGKGVFRQLKTGRVLRIRAGDATVQVSLFGTAAAIERMRQCVVDRIDMAQGRKPRYATQRAAMRAAPPRTAVRQSAKARDRKRSADAGIDAGDDASRRLEAVTYIANVLAKAGFRDYRILQQKEMRRRAGSDYDVVWRTGVSVGALRIYSGRQAREFEELATRVIIRGTRACKAGFRSGVKRDANSPILRFFTQCDGKKGWHALYALVRGKAGRAYLLLSLGNGLSDKDDGAELRAVDDRMVKAMTARQLE